MTTENQNTTEKKTPAYVIYEVVQRKGGRKYWNRVGAAFKHGKGDGLNLVYNNGARLVLMPPNQTGEKLAAVAEKEGA